MVNEQCLPGDRARYRGIEWTRSLLCTGTNSDSNRTITVASIQEQWLSADNAWLVFQVNQTRQLLDSSTTPGTRLLGLRSG